MIPRHIFREYDIRGLHASELTNEVAEAVGHAFANLLTEQGGSRVALGMDIREGKSLVEVKRAFEQPAVAPAGRDEP